MSFDAIRERNRNPSVFYLLFVIAIGFFTYVWGYTNPPALFWDENYHLASAQKYLNGVYFMEPHPPLGKLVIALGEKIVHANPTNDDFIGTDYARKLPAGFSFAGYRLIPVLLAWAVAPLLYGIFLLLTRRPLWSMIFSFLYLFDNAIIVHSRAVMLESTLLFSMVLTILSFLLLLEWKDQPRRFRLCSLLFGIAFACVMTTKLNGLILILLVPALFFALRPRMQQCMEFSALAFVGFIAVYVAVWQTHFALGSRIVASLPDAGYYQASDEYHQILTAGANGSLAYFPIMLGDSLNFVSHYSGGVPRLDLCKEDENGSPFFFWPFGARAINYRWETADGNAYRYLYLQSNPVIWASGLLALLLTAVLLLGQVFLPVSRELKNPFLLLTFAGLYIAYMVAIARLDRVMYLYHYFIPLVFSFILLALVAQEIDRIWQRTLTEDFKTQILLCLGMLVFASFQFYRPLTYYEPMNTMQFRLRNLFPLWELTCVGCQKESTLVVPRGE